MNYIKKLEEENQDMKNELKNMKDQIIIFRQHLCSDKFHNTDSLNCYINISDVHNYLDNIQGHSATIAN